MDKNLDKLNKILEMMDADKVSASDMEQLFNLFMQICSEIKAQLGAKMDESRTEMEGEMSEMSGTVKDLAYSLNELELKLKDIVNTTEKNSLNQVKELSQRLTAEIRRVEKNIPTLPNSSSLALKLTELEQKVLDQSQTQEIKALKEQVLLLSEQVKAVPKSGGITIGGNRPVHVFNNGTEVSGAMTELNFVNATSITTEGKSQRRVNITTGGGGGTVETPTGDVDDSNVTFTVTATPKWIIVNGMTYFDGAGYTIAGLTITLSDVVGTGGYIRAIS